MAKLIIVFLLGFSLFSVISWIYFEGVKKGKKTKKGGDKKK